MKSHVNCCAFQRHIALKAVQRLTHNTEQSLRSYEIGTRYQPTWLV